MRSHRWCVAWCLLLVAMSTACERASTPVAGIDQAPEWRLAPTPRMSIGTADGDEHQMFRHVIGVVRMPNGRLFVADAEPALSLFDSTGRFVKTVSRRGSGPGEYITFRLIPYRSDTIANWDFAQRRITVFDGKGTFVRTINVTVPAVHWPTGSRATQTCCRVASVLSDGSYVLEFPSVVSDQPGPDRHGMVTLVCVRADGVPGDTLGTFRDYLYRYDPTQSRKVDRLLETMRFEFAVIGDTIVGGNGEGQFLLRSVGGLPPDTIRLAGTHIRLTDSVKAVIERAFRDEYSRNPKAFEGGPIEEAFEGTYAEFLPAYTRVTSDAAGRVWLGQWTPPVGVDSMTFHIYSSVGAPVARIRLPKSNWVSHLGTDHITLVESDSLGVQYVRVYDILRPK